jgi:hypothetical protein
MVWQMCCNTQHNDIQYKDSQPTQLYCGTHHNMVLSATFFIVMLHVCAYVEYHYAVCHYV